MYGMPMPGMAKAKAGGGGPQFGMAIGGSANLKVDDEVDKLVEKGNSEGGIRAIKIDIDLKGEKLTLGGQIANGASMEADFQEIEQLLGDTDPCIVMLKTEGGNSAWSLLAWIPEDAPIKTKYGAASAQKNVKEHYMKKQIEFGKDYKMEERKEVTSAAWQEATAVLDEKQKRDLMSKEECMFADAKKEMEKERENLIAKGGGKGLGCAGLGNARISMHESFEKGVEEISRGSADEVLIGKVIAKDGKNEVTGDFLEGVSKASDLKGKLKDDDPCYIIMGQGVEDGLLMISYIPEGATVSARMNVSTYKKDVAENVKRLAGIEILIMRDANDDSDFTDDMAKKDKTPAADPEYVAPKPKPVPKMGYGIPPGAMKMPGM